MLPKQWLFGVNFLWRGGEERVGCVFAWPNFILSAETQAAFGVNHIPLPNGYEFQCVLVLLEPKMAQAQRLVIWVCPPMEFSAVWKLVIRCRTSLEQRSVYKPPATHAQTWYFIKIQTTTRSCSTWHAYRIAQRPTRHFLTLPYESSFL